MTFDREGLQRWYRDAMRRRLAELRDLRSGVAAGDRDAVDAVRSVAQSLRGSGATYGFPELSESAALVESAADASVHRRMEGLVEDVRALVIGGDGAGSGLGAEWLRRAAGEEDVEAGSDGFRSLRDAWESVSASAGVTGGELASRVAKLFVLDTVDPGAPSRAALRLVPEALIREEHVLPLREDAEHVRVATSDPTCLRVEGRLIELTGRTPVFVVMDPDTLDRRIAAALDEASGTLPRRASGERGPGGARRSVGGEQVLVVDDDAAWRVVARSILEKGGYDVNEAGDGEEALESLAAAPGVRLIVADLNMPRMDGLELIWALRARSEWAEVPVIVVTGETDEVLETHLMEEGADDYVRKPLDPRLFLARVAATIRRAEH